MFELRLDCDEPSLPLQCLASRWSPRAVFHLYSNSSVVRLPGGSWRSSRSLTPRPQHVSI